MTSDGYHRGGALDKFSSRSLRPQAPAMRSSGSFQTSESNPYSPYQSTTSIPRYESTDRLNLPPTSKLGASAPHDPPSPDGPYADDMIPMKAQDRPQASQEDLARAPDPESPGSQKNPPLLRHRSRKKKDGFFTGKIPWVVFVVTLVQISVFIGEIIKNSVVTGSPIMIHPQFNPMIGPSTYIQINMGARFVPCMRTTPGVQGADPPLNWPCPNTTTSDPTAATNHCDLSALCGFGGLDDLQPNQWYRFIVPMFLHAGLIHIGFNMLLQLTIGREMELAIGSIRFALVYFSSGIFGFVLGGNFAATAIASTGASGCLFGIIALTLLDLLYCWNERKRAMNDLMWIMVDILVSLALGLFPGLDNYSHIGGFLMGLAAGICILHSPNVLRQRIGDTEPYRQVDKRENTTATAAPAEVTAFTKEPVGFFKGRKPLWWAWWLIRAGALIGVLIAFIVLLNNFYQYRDTCSWCKYLSCLPINNWCSIGNLNLTNTTTNNKRDLLASAPVMVEDLFRQATNF